MAQLHEFFLGLGYKPEFKIYGIFGWEVQYQGKRQIKASPLLRIEYSERYQNPLQLGIKCVSSNRLTPFIPQASELLQQDFARRVYRCNGDKCGWCKNRKGMGPSDFEFGGEKRTICWYVPSDFEEINDDTPRLIQEYALLHEKLAEGK